MADRRAEAQRKIAVMRRWLAAEGLGGLRLRGTDWFAWATAGGSNTVLMAAETGIAEIFVTPIQAFVLTDEIEAERLANEEVPPGFEWHVAPWTEKQVRERFIADAANGAAILSDRPAAGEKPLPETYWQERWVLSEEEQARYRHVGRLAAEAMTEVMHAARSNWTEFDLAGAGAEALWSRGLHPTLTLAAGEARLPRYRHPTASAARLGGRAMLVFCARGHGLYANLTRFVQFAPLTSQLQKLQQAVLEVEAAGLAACTPGQPLYAVYHALDRAYREQGYVNAIREHHQGGITGYQARELVATPQTIEILRQGMAVAFNPSLPGVKVEDTFLLQAGTPENLTADPAWPCIEVAGLARPLPLEATS